MRFPGILSRACIVAMVVACAAVVPCSAQVAVGPYPIVTETLTLDQAIARATSNQPAFAAAYAEQKALALDRKIARTAILPTATYHNQALYTQPNGSPASRIGQTTNAPSPVFIANNAVREYASQGVLEEKVGLGQVAAIHLADAYAARAQAELEVARRGLVTTVVMLYFEAAGGKGKVQIAQRALTEAEHFLEITQKREAAREAAHADVLKAQLAQQQREREVLDAQVAADKSHIELGVLLYPNPDTAFNLAFDEGMPQLPDQLRIQGLALISNPELESSAATVQISQAGTYAARTALLPELALNFTYGIDATNFGVNGPDGIRNLGYSMSAQLNVPVWDWLATERKIKQAKLRETAAHVAQGAAERRLRADIAENYAEASVAHRQLASLNASVTIARESLRLTNLRYVDGESSALEVVDAQNSLITAETAALDGNTRYRLALAGLQTLTGTL